MSEGPGLKITSCSRRDFLINSIYTAISFPILALIPKTIMASEGMPEDKEEARYNISYGLGRNLGALKRRYEKIYGYLGEGIGKRLFIEKTPSDNYLLAYHREGDRRSTVELSKYHSKLLKAIGLSASIIEDKRYPVVYGESSYIDEKEVISLDRAIKRYKIIDTRKKEDLGLEKVVEAYISVLEKKGFIGKDENSSWYASDFSTGEVMLDINGSQPMQAASMIKPFIALAFFHEAKHKRFRYGWRRKQKMESMIQLSDNGSANYFMKKLGGPKNTEEILKDNFSDIFLQTELIEYIPFNERTYKNKASASDYDRFLKALWNNEFPFSKELKRLMALPNPDRIYFKAKDIPSGTLVYNKTGSTARLCGDMGILCARGKDKRRYAYSMIGIIEKSKRSDYRRWIKKRGDIIRQVSNIVYKEMKERHNLV